MMLLAVDTSTAQVGLALFNDAQVAAEMIWHSHQHHTVELAPALAELLKRTGIALNDVQALGVAIGPGSFTSLRVGLSFIKGLALARRLPIVGIPTLDILAAVQPASKLPLAAVLEAGRGRIALGWYKFEKHVWQADGDPQVTTVDALADSIDKPTLVAGELSGEERQRLARKKVNVQLAAPSSCVRRPAVLAELAFARWQAGKVNEPASLAPIYLHLAGPIQA
ncbi:MAG: tRNA (adenosine(37)-N6)-threonylcarbamoyltransferase complex dimerization subunit type 1 TsaB [Chloroflexi bacterium]|nr:tRNA (adenosine(37)-N6)-threonylcarbamoyltransferase complex dimerization subunit type 1 TsaB [Chloroflexota bacterium]MBI3338943.1 tRNA (adenosine(37)-N6)-threonylcarbamoyltransferase complex dimerization subunit type 1 TsaB [Chloroflexota bacterium]